MWLLIQTNDIEILFRTLTYDIHEVDTRKSLIKTYMIHGTLNIFKILVDPLHIILNDPKTEHDTTHTSSQTVLSLNCRIPITIS